MTRITQIVKCHLSVAQSFGISEESAIQFTGYLQANLERVLRKNMG